MRWILSLVCITLAAGFGWADDKDGKYWVFIGTSTGNKTSKGIYRCELDAVKGTLSDRQLVAEVEQPTFLAIHPSNAFLYCVGEYGKLGPKKTGAINSFALDAKTGALKPLNVQSSGGSGPCHVVVDRSGKDVLAANYNSGSVCVLPIQKDGSLGEMTAFIQHEGKSIDPARQTSPHAHSINVDAANRFAFAADLGIDKVLIYRFDPAKGTLSNNDPPDVDVAKGSGPRHFAFHPSGKFAYVINELAQTVTAMAYDADKGSLKPLQTISTVPMPVKGNSTAEVVVHPSGKFLYGSNRGHNSIAIFTIDENTGQLTAAGHQAKDIKTPRNFALDPTGQFLIVANQDSDSLVMFRVDQKTGQLQETGVRVDVPRPMCVRFVPITR
jgi:6-phosphogluconolactonase